MSLLTSDLLLQAVAAVLALLGVLLALWAAIGDRSRGRARCPKCWYNMDALRAAAARDADSPSRLRCPECGHAPRADRHWFRTRRSRLGAVLAIVLLLAAAGSAIAPTIRRNGPRALIPIAVLVRLTDPAEWLLYHRGISADPDPSWVHLELSLRIDTGRITPGGARAIAAAATRSYKRHGRLASPPLRQPPAEPEWLSEDARIESWRFAAYDLVPVAFTRGYCDCGAKPAGSKGAHACPLRAQHCTAAADIVQSLVDPMGWRSYGGTSSEAILIGDQLLVYTDQQTHDAIAELLECMRAGAGKPARVTAGQTHTEVATWNVTDLLTWKSPSTLLTNLQRALLLVDAIQSLITPESWLDYGGDEGTMVYLNGRLIVAAPQENQLAVAQLLTSIRAADAAIWLIEGAHPNAHVATYDMEPIIAGTGSPLLVEHSDSHLRWDEAAWEDRTAAIADIIRSRVDPDSWLAAGGEDSRLEIFDTRLIVSTSPDNHIEIATLLKELAFDN